MAFPVLNHLTNALERLAQQYKGKPFIEGILRVLAGEMQEIEVVLQDLLGMQNIDTADGAQLDVLGRIVMQDREGASDDDYRIRIRAKILVNKSSGTADELIDIFTLLISDSTMVGATVSVDEYPPASVVVRIGGIMLTLPVASRLAQILKQARAAGVRGELRYYTAPPAGSFTFNGTPAQGFNNGVWASGVIAF